MATTNDSQLTDFLNYFNSTRITPNFTAAQKAAEVMKFFSVDTPNPFPCLGITDHGPPFIKVDEVTTFFTQLFKTFPDMQWLSPPPTTPNAPRLTATYQDQWFQHQPPGIKSHHSHPLSQLPKGQVGRPLGAPKGDHNGTPAFAVFTFDGSKSCLIYQLQIYLDRYAMMQSIDIDWVPDPDKLSKVVEAVKVGTGRRVTITIEN